MEVRGTALCGEFPDVLSSGLQVNVVVVIDVFCCDYDLTGKDETSKTIFVSVLVVVILPCYYSQLTCLTCGLDTTNPIADGQNYSSDPRMLQSKMYNETCDQVGSSKTFLSFSFRLKCNYLTIHQNTLIRIYLDLIPYHDSSPKA